jgi:hypothetical protein
MQHHLRGELLLLELLRRHCLARAGLSAETTMNARLILCSVPSGARKATERFYATLLGAEPGRRPWEEGTPPYVWAGDGVKLTVSERRHEREGVMPHFRVDDLEAAVRRLAAAGGRPVAGPYELSVAAADLEALHDLRQEPGFGPREGSLGHGALMRDPDGNLMGLVQLHPFAEPFFEGGVAAPTRTVSTPAGTRDVAR